MVEFPYELHHTRTGAPIPQALGLGMATVERCLSQTTSVENSAAFIYFDSVTSPCRIAYVRWLLATVKQIISACENLLARQS